MQTETQREKELRLQRRDYLRQVDEKLNASQPKPKAEKKSIFKKKEEEKVEESVVEEKEDEVVSIDESSNNDRLFSREDEE